MPTPTTSQAKKSMFTAPAMAPQQPLGAAIAPPPQGQDPLAMLAALRGQGGNVPTPRDKLAAEVVHGRHLGMGGGTEGNASGPEGGNPFTNGFFVPQEQRQGLQTTMPSPETLAQAFAAPQPGGLPANGMTPYGPVSPGVDPRIAQAALPPLPPGQVDPRFSGRSLFTAPGRM